MMPACAKVANLPGHHLWRDELNDSQDLLREIIDIEATYAARGQAGRGRRGIGGSAKPEEKPRGTRGPAR